MSEANVQVDGASPPAACTSAELAAEFEGSFRKLWLIAVGIARNAALADDIVQEAAIVALAKLDQYRPGTNFTAWMGQTVRYVALNQTRKLRRRRVQPLDENTADSTPAGAQRTLQRDTLRLSAIGELPAGQANFDDQMVAALSGVSQTGRACLLLRTIEGMDYREIARILEIPEGTAMSHVHRARRFLREELASHAEYRSKAQKR